MAYKVIKLPKYEYPADNIRRQLSRMHLKQGLMYDTYKALTEKLTVSYDNEDIIFDNVKNHYPFYIVDTDKPNTIVAWGLAITSFSRSGAFKSMSEKIHIRIILLVIIILKTNIVVVDWVQYYLMKYTRFQNVITIVLF